MPPAESHPTLDLNELLGQREWLRALIAGLLDDEGQAEDVYQETMSVALRKAPREPRSLRAWLATVSRRLILNRRVSDARRKDRESTVGSAASDVAPSTLDLVEKLSRQRELVEALLGMSEPYRTTLLLRFWENQGPVAIARREGVTIDTVKSRLRRGLDQLRSELDDRDDDGRAAWRSAFAVAIASSKSPVSFLSRLTPLGRCAVISTSIVVGFAGLYWVIKSITSLLGSSYQY